MNQKPAFEYTTSIGVLWFVIFLTRVPGVASEFGGIPGSIKASTVVQTNVPLKNVSTLTDVVAAEEDWISTHYKGFEFKGIQYETQLDSKNRDIVTFRINGQMRDVIFRYGLVTNSSLESVWGPLIDLFSSTEPRPTTLAQFFRLRDYAISKPVRESVLFLIPQLDNTRQIRKFYTKDRYVCGRVCDVAIFFFLRELRYKKSQQLVFSNLHREGQSLQTIAETSSADEAIDRVKQWWQKDGQRLAERGDIFWR